MTALPAGFATDRLESMSGRCASLGTNRFHIKSRETEEKPKFMMMRTASNCAWNARHMTCGVLNAIAAGRSRKINSRYRCEFVFCRSHRSPDGLPVLEPAFQAAVPSGTNIKCERPQCSAHTSVRRMLCRFYCWLKPRLVDIAHGRTPSTNHWPGCLSHKFNGPCTGDRRCGGTLDDSGSC